MIVEGVVLLTKEDNLMASCFGKDIFDPNVGLKLQKPQNTEQKGGHAKKKILFQLLFTIFLGAMRVPGIALDRADKVYVPQKFRDADGVLTSCPSLRMLPGEVLLPKEHGERVVN